MRARPTRCARASLAGLFALGSLARAAPALAVDSPPQLLDFQVVTPMVDSSSSPAVVMFSAEIQDAAPGVCTAGCDDYGGASQLHLVSPATGQRHTAFFTPVPSLLAGTTHTAELSLPTTAAAGLWEVESIWLADLAGNRQVLAMADLVGAGFDTQVENGSTGGDETPPALTSVGVMPLAFDPSVVGSVGVSVMASELGSGLCTLGCAVAGGPSQVRFVNEATGQVRDAVFSPAGPDLLATVEFSGSDAAGSWTLAGLQLVDVAGNRVVFDAAELDGMGFTTNLVVTNALADEAPPVMTFSSTLPDPVDTTVTTVSATFKVDAEDAETNVCLDVCGDFGSASQVRYRRAGSDHVRFGLLERVAGSPADGSFEASVELPISGSPGVWRPDQLLLVDQAGNRIFLPEPRPAIAAAFALLALAAVRAATGRCPPTR